jgi:hypothetical protein
MAATDAVHRDVGGLRTPEQRRHAGAVRPAAYDDSLYRLPALQCRLDGSRAKELFPDAHDPALIRKIK